jgi:hypothetical protein
MPVREAIRRLEDDDSRRPNEQMQSHVDTAWERWGSASITSDAACDGWDG